ncbi:hypothetical protein B0O80DRAFT_464899 [Mortierella sp. GBAus27b]|nr:hypothetical protein B0O80DRAFT_464899 [Mortierella sp. GBAus27b]
MFDSPDDQPVQAFRCSSTDEIIHIPAITDPEGCKRIVLWSDIQDVFDNAQSIRNGESMLTFMKDEGSTCVMPLRIAYHAGVVLEVVQGSNQQTDTSTGSTVLANTAPGDRHYDDHEDSLSRPPEDTAGIDLLLQCLSKVNTTTPSPPTDTNRMSELIKIPHNGYTQILDGGCSPIMREQGELAASIKKSMDVHFNQLQLEIDKSKELQYHLVDFKKHIQLQLQQTRNHLVEKQAALNDMRQHTYDRLTAASKRLREFLLQGYELHDSPIPRLFIILPKPTGPQHKLTGLESEQFCLHFLCQCETLAKSVDSQSKHKIHLAKHEGYDLVNPMEFFEKYGSHVLATMYMIKYEAITSALSASSLMNIEATYDIAKDNKCLEYFGNDLTDQFDYTINYLQSVLQILRPGAEPMFHEGPENLRPLERLDLKQLQTYMDVKDPGHTLGGLYRMVTLEGSIKWVCARHRVAVEGLRDIIEESKGEFIDQLSKISVKIGSRSIATQFYRAMVNVRGLQELEVTLEWDATMADLQMLADAVTKAGLISFTLDGYHFKDPLWDVFNSGRRYNPIIELGSDGCLQHLGLLGFKNSFSRFSKPSGSFSKLRMLSVGLKRVSFEDNIEPFMQSLDYFPLLVSLELNLHPSYSLVNYGEKILKRAPQLKSLEHNQGYSLMSRISEGKLQDMVMTLYISTSRMDLRFMLSSQGYLAHLTVNSYVNLSQLTNIMFYHPRIHTLRVRDSPCLSHRIVTLVISTRTSLLQDQGFCQLRTFELLPIEANGIRSRLSFVQDSTSYDMVSWIQVRNELSQHSGRNVSLFLKDYGWSVVGFEAWVFNDRFAEALDATISQRGSRLETLEVDPCNLGDAGLDHVATIMEQSPCFKQLHFRFQDVDNEGGIERVRILALRFRQQLTKLTFKGGSLEDWLPRVILVQTRDSWPNVTHLVVYCTNPNHATIPPSCHAWIKSMTAYGL